MPKITPENVQNASTDVLRQRLAELRGVARTQKARDPDQVEADRMRGAATARMSSNPDQGIEWMQKSQALEAKKAEKADINARKTIAKDQYDEAVAAWSRNKGGQAEQNEVLAALADARLYGLTLTNPITNWVQSQQFDTNTGLKKESMEQQKSQQQQQMEAAARREANDNWYRSQQLALEREKLDRAERKANKLTADEAASVGQLSNAEPIFDRLENDIANNLSMGMAVDGINSSNKMVSMVANASASPETQAFANAKNMVRNMIGRQLSGAAISPHEWGAFEANIPAYGDSPAILKQKKKNRLDWVQDKMDRGASRQTPAKPGYVVNLEKADGKDF